MSTEQGSLSSIAYLNLGLLSQASLRELMEIRRGGGRLDQEPHALQTVSNSLAFLCGETFEGSKRIAFDTYEQISAVLTALEAQGITEPCQLLDTLQAIVSSETSKEERLSSAEQAIDFFKSLSRSAILNIRYPEDQMPLGVRAFAFKGPASTEER